MMKKHKKITLALATASCSLLNVAPVQAAEIDDNDIAGWDLSAAVLFYSETDRVTAIEPVIKAKKMLDTDEYLTLKLTLDSLTGASASGAVPTDRPQTFTTPSGNGTYNIAASETALDDSFLDTRVALNASWEKPLSRTVRMTLGGNFSKEYDYTSISASGLFAFDVNQRNTTLSAGLSFANDSIEPEGNIPTAFGIMQPVAGIQPRAGGASDSKTTADLLLGVTQVIDRNSLMQFNYSFSQTDGYQTDPFKVLSVIDPTGRPVLQDAATGLPQVVFESRPDSRTKHSLYSQYKRYIDGDVLDISYRYLFDDWDLNSHTVDFRYRYKLNGKSYLQPHLRYYQQTAVDFYKPFLLQGSVPAPGNTSQFATADYRLGDFNAYTIGLEYGRTSERPWSIAAEYYIQGGNEPDGKFGELNNQTLAPDVKAVMLRFNYDF